MKLVDNSLKTNWKYLAIVVVLGLLGSGGILLLKVKQPMPFPPQVVQQTSPPAPSPQPQTLDTSGWQTYRNDEFGFEVRYPKDWSLQEEGKNIYFSPDHIYTRESAVALTIVNLAQLPPPPPVTSLSAKDYWIKLHQGYDTLRIVRTDYYGDILIKSRFGIEYQYVAAIISGDIAAQFTFGKNLDRTYDSAFDQILSTFRFVKE